MSRISGRPDISTEHVCGLRLRVARWRVGAAGTPLLFLNGIGADLTAAAPLLAQIHGREVWTLDMPGVGGSPDAILPYGAPTIAAVVMEIADRLGHDIVDIAGFSWGGALAQQIAIQFPGRVGRLVLMATTPVMGAPGIGWGAMFDDDMQASGLKIQTATPLGIAYQSMAMAGWSSVALLPALKNLPTLVLVARDDGVMPPCYGQMLASLIDRAVLEEVAGSHLFPFTHAAATAQRISAFLGAAPVRQAAA